MKKPTSLILLLFICCSAFSQVSTGLWFPHQAVSDEVYQLLRKDGIKMSREQIYSTDETSLSTAILSLSQEGGLASPFATASFISDDGLIITNYHCVSRYIKDISTPENDYVKYGCWAESREQEAPLHNLQVNQLIPELHHVGSIDCGLQLLILFSIGICITLISRILQRIVAIKVCHEAFAVIN